MERPNTDIGTPGHDTGDRVSFALGEQPGAFGVYDEGDGILSVYMTPFCLDCLVQALEKLDLGGSLFDVTPRWGVLDARAVTPAELRRISAPLELVHAPDGDVVDPITLMAAPQEALPLGSGRRLALSLHDADHAVLYTRDEAICAAVLSEWLEARVHALAGVATVPPVTDHALSSVLYPLPIEAWRRLGLERHSRYWALDVSAVASDLDGSETVVEEQRWVGCPTRAWRAGWSW